MDRRRGLVALVYAAYPLRDAVRSAPWVMGPGLWLCTALGAGSLLRSRPARDQPRRALALATVAGGGADALVVAAGHRWPGLVIGIAVFAATTAILGENDARSRAASRHLMLGSARGRRRQSGPVE